MMRRWAVAAAAHSRLVSRGLIRFGIGLGMAESRAEQQWMNCDREAWERKKRTPSLRARSWTKTTQPAAETRRKTKRTMKMTPTTETILAAVGALSS